MTSPRHDPSIDSEPHLRQSGFRPDRSEATAASFEGTSREKPSHERVEHTVWDEPALSPELSGAAPEEALTYGSWLQEQQQHAAPGASWAYTICLALVAGPLAIVGTFLSGFNGATVVGLVMLTVVGPVTEELMKAALPLWTVEKRPYRFESSLQIALCMLASGLAFAAVENVIYLYPFADAPPGLVRWRWTVCVGLHMTCSFIAGLGLIRIWRQTVQTQTRPQLSLGSPYMVAAIVIHGLYNAFVFGLEAGGFEF